MRVMTITNVAQLTKFLENHPILAKKGCPIRQFSYGLAYTPRKHIAVGIVILIDPEDN
jgi:hypothetical protein